MGHPSHSMYLMLQMTKFEQRCHRELAKEVTHPVNEYAVGSPQWERLWQAIEAKKKFPPCEFVLNV